MGDTLHDAFNSCRLPLKHSYMINVCDNKKAKSEPSTSGGQKYLRCLFLSKTLSGKISLSLEGPCSNLQQLYIHFRNTVPTETFTDTLCSHGGLDHVILCVKSLTVKSIENMIEHSSNLLIFCVYLYSRAFLKSQLKQLITAIKETFSKRKLFNGGSFDIQVSYRSSGVEVEDDADLLSLWDSD